MKKSIVSVFLVLASLCIVCHSAIAQDQVNPLCQRLGLGSLSFLEVDEKWTIPENFCLLPEHQIPTQVLGLLHQIQRLHSKVASILKIPEEQLVSQPIQLCFYGNSLGPFASAAGQGSLLMGIFSDWSGEPLNEAIYIHELGHILATSKNSSLIPRDFAEMADGGILLTETIADLIAYQVMGEVSSYEPSLPLALQKPRVLDTTRSFSEPLEHFSDKRASAYFLENCVKLESEKTHSPHSRILCEEILAASQSTSSHSKLLTEFSAELSLEYEFFLKGADPHLIGLPINSFLLDLQLNTGLDVLSLFLSAMREANTKKASPFICQIPKLAEWITPVIQDTYSLRDIFREFLNQKEMLPYLKETWPTLWKKHEMDRGLQLMDVDAGNHARFLSLSRINEAIKNIDGWNENHTNNPTLRKTGCWVPFSATALTGNEQIDSFGEFREGASGCTIVCVPSG